MIWGQGNIHRAMALHMWQELEPLLAEQGPHWGSHYVRVNAPGSGVIRLIARDRRGYESQSHHYLLAEANSVEEFAYELRRLRDEGYPEDPAPIQDVDGSQTVADYGLRDLGRMINFLTSRGTHVRWVKS